jgi:transketolase
MDSPYHGHPTQEPRIGVEVTSGSLGQGLSFGVGTVLAGRLANKDFRVYVLTGDGECDEGQIWEAAMSAAHFRADSLTAIVDYNAPWKGRMKQRGSMRCPWGLPPAQES